MGKTLENGKLYGTGTGPGDPGLITLNAIKTIKKCGYIAVPNAVKEKALSYQIALAAVPQVKDKKCICVDMPMTRDKNILEQSHIKAADIIVTGEGCLDGQTVMGKAPAGVAKIAKQYGKPVIAFSGCVTDQASACNNAGIDAFFPVLRSVCTLDEAMEKERAQRNIEDTVEQVFRLIKIMG